MADPRRPASVTNFCRVLACSKGCIVSGRAAGERRRAIGALLLVDDVSYDRFRKPDYKALQPAVLFLKNLKLLLQFCVSSELIVIRASFALDPFHNSPFVGLGPYFYGSRSEASCAANKFPFRADTVLIKRSQRIDANTYRTT